MYAVRAYNSTLPCEQTTLNSQTQVSSSCANLPWLQTSEPLEQPCSCQSFQLAPMRVSSHGHQCCLLADPSSLRPLLSSSSLRPVFSQTLLSSSSLRPCCLLSDPCCLLTSSSESRRHECLLLVQVLLAAPLDVPPLAAVIAHSIILLLRHECSLVVSRRLQLQLGLDSLLSA